MSPDLVGALRAAWFENPHPALARALPVEAPFAGSAQDWVAAWRSDAPRGPLVAALFLGSLADVGARLTAIEGARDPQLSNALEQVLRDPPWTSNGARGVLAQVFDLVRASGDPRFVALAGEVQWTMRKPQEAWMRGAFAAAIVDLPAERPLTDAQAALLASIPKAATQRSVKRPDFATVYAAPDDDAARHVLADALIEAGDPRGELLVLQLKSDPTAADRKREKALLAAHAKEWLAPFGRAIGADVAFRRGFPAEGLVKLRDRGDAERYGGLVEWATFERLTWSPPKTGEHRRAAGFIGPAFRHLRIAEGPHLPLLLESDTVFALREIAGQVESRETLAALLVAPQLPALRVLHVTDHTFDREWLEAVKAWGTLEELGLRMSYPSRLLPWLAAAERTPLRRFSLGTALRFHRAPDGSFSVLELLDPHGTYQVGQQLATLPAACVSLLRPPERPSAWPDLDRIVRGSGGSTSIAAQATRDLDLNGPAQLRPCAEGVLVCDGSTICLVDRTTRAVLRRWRERGRWTVLAGAGWFVQDEGRVVAVDRATGERRTAAEAKKIEALAVSDDGGRVAVSTGSKVRVIEVATGETVFETKGRYPALDDRGRRLWVDSELFDLASGTVERHERSYTPSFFPEGGYAVVYDEQLRVTGEGAFTAKLAVLAGGRILRRGTRFVHLAHGPATIFDASGAILATLSDVSGIALEGDVLWMVRGGAVRELASMPLP